jgi:hypothetical protein
VVLEHEDLGKEYASVYAAQDLEILLPPSKLTFSRGPIEKIVDGIIYHKASTRHGISGGCLVYEGQVYGSSWLLDFLIIRNSLFRRCEAKSKCSHLFDRASDPRSPPNSTYQRTQFPNSRGIYLC